MFEPNANQHSNQIESLWMHAESERQDIMADFYGDEGAYLLQYDDLGRVCPWMRGTWLRGPRDFRSPRL